MASSISFSTAVTIESGESLSDAVDVQSSIVVGVIVPSWTSAAVSFQVSYDGVTFYDVKTSDGNEYSLTASDGNAYFVVAPYVLLGARKMKVRSGTSASPVSQGADRILGLVLKEL